MITLNPNIHFQGGILKLNTSIQETSFTFITESVSPTFSPSILINTGDVLKWSVNGVEYNENVPSIDLSSLTGDKTITVTSTDNFEGLTQLGLGNRGIKSIDLSKLLNLERLYINNNPITTVDLSLNTKLEQLHSYNSLLTELDLSNNLDLELVTSSSNNISSINITGLTKLHALFINENPITSLDISTNVLLNNLRIESLALTQSSLDDIFSLLTAHGILNGELRYASQLNNVKPSFNSISNYEALDARSWYLNGELPEDIPLNWEAPKLSNFRVLDTQKDRVYFDSSKEVTASTFAGFTISDKTINSITINTGGLSGYFTVDAPFTYWDNNTIRYIGFSDLVDTNSKPLYNFTLTHIKNNIVVPTSTGTTYYVSTTGNNSNNGLTEGSPFLTLEHAVDQVTTGAGDTIYVKSGAYGSENINLTNKDGLINNPFKIIGYKNSPTENDISSNYYNYGVGVAFDSSEMPLFDGADRTTGTFLNVTNNTSYVVIKNIQGQNYRKGLYLGSTNTNNFNVKNLNLKNFGTTSVSGDAIISANPYFDTNNFRFENCFTINASFYNFIMRGDMNLVDNLQSYCDESDGTDGIATDYYCDIQGDNNIVINSKVEKLANDGHLGHSFSTRAQTHPQAWYNLFDNCVSVNTQWTYNARNADCKYNVWKNCESHANNGFRSSANCGIYTGGGEFNTWENISIHDIEKGISISNGHNNILRNIIIDNVDEVFYSNVDNDGSFEGNKIYNLTVNNADYFARLRKVGSTVWSMANNEIKNSVFNDVTNFEYTGTDFWSFTGVEWDYNAFYQTWGTIGTNVVNANPLFTNIATGDFSLQSNSPLRNSGIILGDVRYSYNGLERPQGLTQDIGAYEFQESVSQTYLLDTFNNSKAAFSLRKLKASSTNSIEIRRDSDDALTNVVLHANQSISLNSLVTAGGTLGTWIGANTAYVKTVFDQSGNGYDLIQPVNGNQPIVVDSGSLILENGQPTIQNVNDDSVFMYADLSPVAEINNVLTPSVFGVLKGTALNGGTSGTNSTAFALQPLTPSVSRRVVGLNLETSATSLRLNGGNSIFGHVGNVQTLYSITKPVVTSPFVMRANQTPVNLNSSGSNILSIQEDSYLTIFKKYETGAIDASPDSDIQGFRGNLQELIWFFEDKTDDVIDIETEINNFYAIN